jgi:glycosyltransferase involved in cell wall biosynthesis
MLNMIKKLDRQKFIPVVLLKELGPLCDELVKLKVQIYFEKNLDIYPYNQNILKYRSIRQIINIGISIIKFNRWIRFVRPEIIHINTMMMFPYCIPARYKQTKIIIHMREHWPKGEHIYQFRMARYIINKFTDHIIAINMTSSNNLNLISKTTIIYDWLDFENREDTYDLENYFVGDSSGLKNLLYLGGMQEIKGAYEVVYTFSKHILAKDVRLLFVGTDKKDYDKLNTFRGILKYILRRFHIPTIGDKILNIINNDERIIVLPPTMRILSLIKQSFCIISYPKIPHAILPIAEAIYLNRPIISADTPEAREYSDNGKYAVLYDINNINMFKESIHHVMNNRDNIVQNIQVGIAYIKNKFDTNRNSLIMNKLYKRMLQ